MDVSELLNKAIAQNASDLHLSSGVEPIIRVDEDLQALDSVGKLDEAKIKALLLTFLPKKYRDSLTRKVEIDFSFEVKGIDARFRANVFYQNRGISVSIRYLPLNPPTLSDLNLPQIFADLCKLQAGLILVTGPTGSGKSTTLAAMIDHINSQYAQHIVTIEDPIEYTHSCKKSLVQQREVSEHTVSFDSALKAALREDPDYILVGEMRDLETIRLALTAAETGHLVFATLHTRSASDSVDRIIDVFPSHEKALIRTMLAKSLQAVVSQRLLKKIEGGRVAAHEIMVCNHAIRNLIRENKVVQIYSSIQTGRKFGMHTLAQNVQELIYKGVIDRNEYAQLAID